MTSTDTSAPSRAEQIVYLTEWAAANGCTLQIRGQVGFGRDATGILGACDAYVDTADAKQAHYDGEAQWWEPEDSYHKHDCLAVLGHGDGPLRQLYDWVRWLDGHGFTAETVYREPAHNIDLALHGIALTKLVRPESS